MGKETRPERKLTVQEITARIAGFFDGKLDEIDEEIKQVESWPSQVRLGHKIRRQDQEEDALLRLKDEMERVKKYVLGALGHQTEEP